MMHLKIIYSLVLGLLALSSAAQELPRNLVYANENLVFEKLYILGDQKLLHFSDEKRQNRRFVYLLNEQNVVTDTLQVEGNDYFLLTSDSTFSIRGLSEYGSYILDEHKIQIRSAFVSYVSFHNEMIEPNFIVGGYIIGSKYDQSRDCVSYHYVDGNKLEALASLSSPTYKYGFDELDTLYMFNMEMYEDYKGRAYDKGLVQSLFNKSKSCLSRMSYPIYGRLSASLDQDTYTFYERKAGKIFSIDISGEPKLTREFQFPLKNARIEGWKYLFDFKLKKHYAVKRIDITEIPEGLNKRKARKIEKEYSYELYELLPLKNTFELKPLYKLRFDPVLVDNDLVYEIIQENKKGSAIFFHPLDPNYQYKKSNYLDYGSK